MPTDAVLLPVELMVYLAPFPPKDTLVLFFPKFSLTPGAILALFLKRKPIINTTFSLSDFCVILFHAILQFTLGSGE